MSLSSSWLPRIANTPCGAVQRREQLRDRADVRTIGKGDVIAAEDDQVWAKRQREVDRRTNIVRAHKRAVMDVGQQRDAEPVQCGRKSRDRQRGFRGAEVVASVGDAVGGRATDRRGGASEDALERCASSDEH